MLLILIRYQEKMSTKIWLLKPKGFLADADNPWIPWYNKVFGFVISAETEEMARGIADNDAGLENWISSMQPDKRRHPWLNKKYSTCVYLTDRYKPGVIIKDYREA